MVFMNYFHLGSEYNYQAYISPLKNEIWFLVIVTATILLLYQECYKYIFSRVGPDIWSGWISGNFIFYIKQ